MRTLDPASINHEKYLERKAIYRSFGYDVDEERGFVLKMAQPIQGRILEAGTGKGYFAVLLAQIGHPFTTFDISRQEQDYARLNLRYFGFEHLVDFRLEDGEALSFPDHSYDVIFCVNALHHFRKPYQVVHEMLRVLAPAGKFVLSDFTDTGFSVIKQIHAREGGNHETGEVRIADIQQYLLNQKFKIKTAQTRFQEILVASNG